MEEDSVADDGELPGVIPIFPLPGALLLPGGELPLNIFEPRYLFMVRDAMARDRTIGMVQPRPGTGEGGGLYGVGCAGRIGSFGETEDGRILISLRGISRFVVAEELARTTPYRQVKADYTPYAADRREEEHLPPARRAALLEKVRSYIERRGLVIDWPALLSVPDRVLVNSLAMIAPFPPADKQALLEAKTLDDRAAAMILLISFALAADGGETGPSGRPN